MPGPTPRSRDRSPRTLVDMDDTTHSEGPTDPTPGEATATGRPDGPVGENGHSRPSHATTPIELGGSPSHGDSTPPPGTPDRLSAPLRRPKEGRMVGGVCAGMATAWRVDPLALRIAFVATALLAFPVGPLLYLACWILMPAEPDAEPDAEPARTATPAPGTVEPLVTEQRAQ